MKISNDYDDQVAQALQARLDEAIAAAEVINPEITSGEIIVAVSETLGSVLSNITCPGCRRKHKKFIERILPMILRGAMVEAAHRPQLVEHVH